MPFEPSFQSRRRSWRPDDAGRRVLFETFWSSTGWKKNPIASPEAFQVAKQAGYMFEPTRLRHDEIVERLIAVRERITAREVGDAFADSLVTGRLDLRSALGSFGAALNLPRHKLGRRAAFGPGQNWCGLCHAYESAQIEDLNVLNFERFKWGGVRHADPLYALLDLTRFEASELEEAASEGHFRLSRLLEIAGDAPPDARPNDLVKRIKPLIPGNDYERRAIIGCLAYAGVLQPRDHEGFFDGYPTRRPQVSDGKNDWPYPAQWWRGRDGVNTAAVKVYFPEIAV